VTSARRLLVCEQRLLDGSRCGLGFDANAAVVDGVVEEARMSLSCARYRSACASRRTADA
jgi:hypothetical protein